MKTYFGVYAVLFGLSAELCEYDDATGAYGAVFKTHAEAEQRAAKTQEYWAANAHSNWRYEARPVPAGVKVWDRETQQAVITT